MGQLFSIDDEVKAIIQDGLDDLITELGKTCTLVYPPSRYESCPNCLYDPMSEKSSNRYRAGGPIEFADGSICPYCNGRGRIATETTEDVELLCELNPKKFTVPVPGLLLGNRQPDALLQTKGFIKDWPKVEKCDYLLYQKTLAGLGPRRYKLAGEPNDVSNIIQDRYFVCLWERVG